jgi:predicted metal-dependent hydrolase
MHVQLIFCADRNYTLIGTAADTAVKGKPTMCLNLAKKPDEEVKYTVLHETGHALGFGHEHQHPKLGKCVFNEDNVIKDLKKNAKIKNAENFYKQNFEDEVQVWMSKDQNYAFDPNSVMKYK